MSERDLHFNQFVRNLEENKIAKNYFLSRGLSKKLINENLLGFCPIYSRYIFPLLRGRLIIPIHDVYGNTIALAGRQIPELKESLVNSYWETFGSEPAKCQDRIVKWTKGKWINEPYQKAKNLFFLNHSKDHARRLNYIILVEGYFDVLSLYDNGVKNVAALCGTAITDQQVALASRFCDNIVLLMDSDDPGIIAANKAAKKIEDLGLNPYKVFLPPNMDPDDFAKNYDLSFLEPTILKMFDTNKKELYINV